MHVWLPQYFRCLGTGTVSFDYVRDYSEPPSILFVEPEEPENERRYPITAYPETIILPRNDCIYNLGGAIMGNHVHFIAAFNLNRECFARHGFRHLPAGWQWILYDGIPSESPRFESSRNPPNIPKGYIINTLIYFASEPVK